MFRRLSARSRFRDRLRPLGYSLEKTVVKKTGVAIFVIVSNEAQVSMPTAVKAFERVTGLFFAFSMESIFRSLTSFELSAKNLQHAYVVTVGSRTTSKQESLAAVRITVVKDASGRNAFLNFH